MPKINTYIKLEDGAFWTDENIMTDEEAITFVKENIDKINKEFHIVISSASIKDLCKTAEQVQVEQ